MKKIEITCTASNNIHIDQLKDLQGDLKSLTVKNLEKLKKSIIKYGFTAPMFVWVSGDSNYILDGHQRLTALKSLQEDGYEVPPLPTAYIHAESKEEAKERLLHITSQYGEFDTSRLEAWLEQAGGLISDTVRFANEEIALFKDEEKHPDKYTSLIKAPIYEPTGEEPEVSELYNTEKAQSLIAEIKKAKIKDKELEAFLLSAAGRHTAFRYDKIAEFYAHASAPIQDLMEKSALVIIDFNKAVESGFVALCEGIADQYALDTADEE